jgi:large subunit ribosomal protein L22
MAKKDIKINEDKNEELQETKVRRKSNKARILTKSERKEQGIGKDVASATSKYVRISPRKVRIVMNLIRNKNIKEVYGILNHTPKAASPILQKVVKSAQANAEVKNLNQDVLYVSQAYANEGPTLKRIMPRAKGSASRINKRTSHITVVLSEKN